MLRAVPADSHDHDGRLVRRHSAGDRNRARYRAAAAARHHHHRRIAGLADPHALHDSGDLSADRPAAGPPRTAAGRSAGGMISAVVGSRRGAYSRAMSEHSSSPLPVPEAIADCPRCQKPLPLCICDSVTPVESRIKLLILQHPQEQDRALGTARLAAQHFKDAVVRVGLSWPSLAKALGRPVADPARWAILYLGSAKASDLDPDSEVIALTRKGEAAEGQRAILKSIEGVILLDGTWSQAKALWWRNP